MTIAHDLPRAIDSHDPFESECPISYVYLRPRNFETEDVHEDGLSSPDFHFLSYLLWVFSPHENNTQTTIYIEHSADTLASRFLSEHSFDTTIAL
jgi:hypothetical protein